MSRTGTFEILHRLVRCNCGRNLIEREISKRTLEPTDRLFWYLVNGKSEEAGGESLTEVNVAHYRSIASVVYEHQPPVTICAQCPNCHDTFQFTAQDLRQIEQSLGVDYYGEMKRRSVKVREDLEQWFSDKEAGWFEYIHSFLEESLLEEGRIRDTMIAQNMHLPTPHRDRKVREAVKRFHQEWDAEFKRRRKEWEKTCMDQQ